MKKKIENKCDHSYLKQRKQQFGGILAKDKTEILVCWKCGKKK